MLASRKPLGLASAQPFRPAPMAMDGLLQTPKIKKPGFGSNGEIGQLGALLLSASGNPAGQALMQMQARRQEAEREQQDYQRRLDDQWSMWERKQQYERENPAPRAPTQLERYMAGAGIDPASEQGREMMLQAARNAASPLQGVRVTNPDGSEGIQFIRPGGVGGPEMPPEVLDEIPDEGGPSLTSSGGFRPGF